jgi:dTDP-4-dehydrorhamnose reductase
MGTLLVTGMSGFLGWHLGVQAQTEWQVIGTYHRNPVRIPGVTGVPLDLQNRQEMDALLAQVQPDAVIHAAAIARPNLCQEQPELSHAINVTASCHLADRCAERDIPLAFISTDLVFDGHNAPYCEDAPVSPVNLYGEQKAAAEQVVLTRHPGAVVCRMPLMFGAAPMAPSFLQGFLKTLQEGRSLRLFTDEFRTPISGDCAARGILLALTKTTRILHLGGQERLSRYEFGLIMAEVLNLPTEQLLPARQADVPMAAPRPADVSMDSSRAFALGYQPARVRDALTVLKPALPGK